jgi:hypothetical protein
VQRERNVSDGKFGHQNGRRYSFKYTCTIVGANYSRELTKMIRRATAAALRYSARLDKHPDQISVSDQSEAPVHWSYLSEDSEQGHMYIVTYTGEVFL